MNHTRRFAPYWTRSVITVRHERALGVLPLSWGIFVLSYVLLLQVGVKDQQAFTTSLTLSAILSLGAHLMLSFGDVKRFATSQAEMNAEKLAHLLENNKRNQLRVSELKEKATNARAEMVNVRAQCVMHGRIERNKGHKSESAAFKKIQDRAEESIAKLGRILGEIEDIHNRLIHSEKQIQAKSSPVDYESLIIEALSQLSKKFDAVFEQKNQVLNTFTQSVRGQSLNPA